MDASATDGTMTLLPRGTKIARHDNLLVVEFPTEDDAIIFCEWVVDKQRQARDA
jgi:hypothetical protein